MSFRKSFVKPFKKLKDKLPGGSGKRDGGSGSGDGRKGREADVEGSEASRSNSYLHSEASIVGTIESGPSREGSNIDGRGATLIDAHPPSTPLISHVSEPDSM